MPKKKKKPNKKKKVKTKPEPEPEPEPEPVEDHHAQRTLRAIAGSISVTRCPLSPCPCLSFPPSRLPSFSTPLLLLSLGPLPPPPSPPPACLPPIELHISFFNSLTEIVLSFCSDCGAAGLHGWSGQRSLTSD